MNFIKKYFLRAVQIYILLVVLLVTVLFFQSINKEEYFPSYEDELIYYNSAKLFNESNSLKSAFCLNEDRSYIGDFNWYGPFYHVIYGGTAKVFGFNNIFFIVFNYFLFLGSILISFLLKIDLEKRFFFIAIFISTYASFSFIFTYYPELLHVFLTLILLVVYTRITSKPKLVYLFITLIIVFSMIRYSTVFWIFTLLFLKDTQLSFKRRLLISMIVFLLILVYMKLFTAPAFVVGLKEIHTTEDFHFLEFVKNILTNGVLNVYQFFDWGNPAMISLLLLFVLATYNIFSTKIKIKDLEMLGIYFCVVLTLLVFIFFYTTVPILFEKQTLFMVPLVIFCLLKTEKNIHQLLLISVVIFFPFSITKAKNYIAVRKESFYNLAQYEGVSKDLSTIFTGVNTPNRELNVLWDFSEFDVENHLTFAFLQVSKRGFPILYTTNIKQGVKPFDLQNKIHIDYILSKNEILLKNTRCVKKGKYYYLYKRI